MSSFTSIKLSQNATAKILVINVFGLWGVSEQKTGLTVTLALFALGHH